MCCGISLVLFLFNDTATTEIYTLSLHDALPIALAKDIASRPGLSFAGFMLYPPETAVAETQAFLDAANEGVRAEGLAPRMVSSGGTPNLANLGKIGGITEHRAGTYIFND